MRNLLLVVSIAFLLYCCPSQSPAGNSEKDVSRILAKGKLPEDGRLGELRNLRDADHPWKPPKTKQEWLKEAQSIRERLLVSTGLWPLPPKPSLKPIIHGKIDRGDYTIEKVFFASHPGHYVTGNLYRPTKIEGKTAAVLCPHGHWRNGRFYDAGIAKARAQIDKGAEKYIAGARFPLQARLVQLTRMGCVVFHYDMVGYADSQQIGHRSGFTDVQAGLRLQNFMGLQTFNSMRALDFLLSLPEVDPCRVAVTGASGGGTQTFMLCALDSRPAAAFPAVMVSTGMQGGCICENADYLRIGINNIAIAALFAPKPMALSGADDWTIAIETKGLPELRQVYSLYGKTDFVYAKAFPQFKHNYNRVARTVMYNWFNQHLKLGLKGPIDEQDFWPVLPADLSVFDKHHPLPKDAGTADDLKKYLAQVAEKQYAQLLAATTDNADEYRRVVGTAARVILDSGVPGLQEIEAQTETSQLDEKLKIMKGTVGRKGTHEQVPFVALIPEETIGTVVIWIDGNGKSHLFDENGKVSAAVERLLDSGRVVISADVFGTGEFLADGKTANLLKVDERYHGYTFGYNRPLLSNRVRDILTLIGGVFHHEDVDAVELIGTGDAGPWTLLARALAGEHVENTIVDARGFSFANVESTADAMFLPGALKYGGIGGLAALAAPAKLTVAGAKGITPAEQKPLTTLYAPTKDKLTLEDEPLTPSTAVDKLLN